MKKTLSLLTLATLITSFSTLAHAENLFVINKTGMNSIQVTVTEEVDGEKKIKDTFCLMPMNQQYLQDYTAGKDYKVKAEFQNGYCDGAAMKTLTSDLHMYSQDMQVEINEEFMEIRTRQ